MKPSSQAKRAFFCVVQFAPSARNAMTRNIGLLLICTESRFIQGMFVNGYKRLLSALAPDTSDTPERLSADCNDGNDIAARKSFRSLAELKSFLCTLPGNIRLAESSSAEVSNPYSELSSLYDRYVVHQDQPSACRRQAWPEESSVCSAEVSADLSQMASAS